MTTRERLIAFVQRNPGATAALVARALGVSRQRIHQLVKAEKLTLARYTANPHRMELTHDPD